MSASKHNGMIIFCQSNQTSSFSIYTQQLTPNESNSVKLNVIKREQESPHMSNRIRQILSQEGECVATESWCERREDQAQSNRQTAARLLLCCTGSSPNHTNQRPAKVTHSAPFHLNSRARYSIKARHSNIFSTYSPTFIIWDIPICWSLGGRDMI